MLPQGQIFLVKDLYSDFKRHDLGPALYEREYDATLVTEFVTEPLWSVGFSAPYGHDGRSINLDSVIRHHGGDAAASAARYAGLDSRGKSQVVGDLQTLVLFPPDDTASNLNTGNAADIDDIQNPVSRSSINLGALFHIPEEGPE